MEKNIIDYTQISLYSAVCEDYFEGSLFWVNASQIVSCPKLESFTRNCVKKKKMQKNIQIFIYKYDNKLLWSPLL